MADAAAVLTAEISASPEKLIAGFAKADQATGAWATAAQRHMQTAQASFNGLDFTVVTSKAKAEQLKLIELQHQLDVARAAGSTKTVAALTEEIALLGKVRQLRAVGLKPDEAVSAAKAAQAGVNAAREAAEAAELAAKKREKLIGNPVEALSSVFGRARLGVLEEGGAKIGLFGSALEALGPIGIAVGAGLLIAAEGAEQVKKSLEFAEDVERTSKALGVTTTQLQEFDYAASGTTVGVSAGREALQRFNEVFGRYSAGLAQGRTASTLNGLGFTPESARQIGGTTEALEKALTAIAKLQNPQQRAAIADRLGLTAFLPVVAEGTEGIEKFIAAMAQAQGAGAVISPDQIKRAAELNDKLEQIEHTASVELKQAFIDLGPAILAAVKLVERLAHGVDDVVESFGSIQHASRRVAAQSAGVDLDYRSTIYNTGLAGKVDPKTGVASGGLLSFAYNNHQQDYNAANARIAAIDAEDAADAKAAKGGPARDLAPPKKPKKGPEDQTADLDKSAIDAADGAAKDLASAQAALTKNIEAHAAAESRAVDADTAKRVEDIAAEEKKVVAAAAKHADAHSKAQLALLEAARSDTLAAAAAKKEQIAREAEAAQAVADLQFQQQQGQYRDTILTARTSLATTAQQRATLELQVFRDEQVRALESREQTNAAKVKDGSLTQAQSDQDTAGLRGSQDAQLVARRTQEQRQINPLYARANPTTSVQDDLQGIEAKGLDSVTDDLASLATNAKSAKAEFHDLINSMITDLIKLGLQRSLEAPLANALFGASPTNNLGALGETRGSASIASGVRSFFSGLLGGNASGVPGAHDVDTSAFSAIDALKLPSFLPQLIPGFATGTDDTPGGLTRYDEQGTEGYVPPGAQIIPNETLKGLAALTPEKLGGGATTIVQGPQFHLESPVVTQDLLDQMTGISQAHYAAAVATSRKDQQRSQRASRQNMTRF